MLFYSRLLGREPVEHHPDFAMFKLNEATTLGLWAAHDAQPASSVRGGGTEICVTLANDAAVEQAASAWEAMGWPVLQAPTAMDFGYTATTADPDGHRIRVFRPA